MSENNDNNPLTSKPPYSHSHFRSVGDRSLANNPIVPQQQLDDGKPRLHKFVLDTLAGLIKLEERQNRLQSGLRLFCRIDVAVLKNADGDYVYWVNEVDRTPNASLFACQATMHAELLAKTFVATLEKLYKPRDLGKGIH